MGCDGWITNAEQVPTVLLNCWSCGRPIGRGIPDHTECLSDLTRLGYEGKGLPFTMELLADWIER